MAVAYEPIKIWNSAGVGTSRGSRHSEGATQTFKLGVPLVLSSGHVVEAAFGAAEIVFGVSAEPAHNNAVAGVGTTLSVGTPPNQPSASIIPIGAPINDGRCGYYEANGDNRFTIMLADGQVFTPALVTSGALYGLVKDGTSGFWYIDPTDTTGDNAVVKIDGVDPSSPNTVAAGARVIFHFDSDFRHFD